MNTPKHVINNDDFFPDFEIMEFPCFEEEDILKDFRFGGQQPSVIPDNFFVIPDHTSNLAEVTDVDDSMEFPCLQMMSHLIGG